MNFVLVTRIIPGADKHVEQSFMFDDVRRPEQPFAIFVPIRSDGEALLMPGVLRERFGRCVKQVLAGVAGEVDWQDMGDAEHVPQAVGPVDDCMVVDAPRLGFTGFGIKNLSELAGLHQDLFGGA